jgi:hypothetical protein
MLSTWMQRGNGRLLVIPAQAGIQSQGTPWIPAYAGMTVLPYARDVCPPEYITRSRGKRAEGREPNEGAIFHAMLTHSVRVE